jgi:hypothetical protein
VIVLTELEAERIGLAAAQYRIVRRHYIYIRQHLPAHNKQFFDNHKAFGQSVKRRRAARVAARLTFMRSLCRAFFAL